MHIQVPNERLFRLEFPERPGALKDFLDTLGYGKFSFSLLLMASCRSDERIVWCACASRQSSNQWNVSLFHYRNHGADVGDILVAFQVPPAQNAAFSAFLNQVGFPFVEETDNAAYTQFLL